MESLVLSSDLYLFLAFIAVVAGLIDTLAGGGGLIVLPALILSGIPPHLALGTNKLQGSMGTATATLLMLRRRRVQWQEVRPQMIIAFVGSSLGTMAVQFVRAEALSFAIPLVLAAIACYFLLAPQPLVKREALVSPAVYKNLVVPAIGWYDGMFGPGTGSFFAAAGVSLRGLGLIEATAVAKTLNFATNVASLAVFLVAGKILWSVGLVMMAGQMFGAWLGTKALFSINPNYLRLLVVVMCLSMLVRYLLS